MKIGVLSDTHDHLDPAVERLFVGVNRIVHAGDVCQASLIAILEAIAPVTVARGNNDYHLGWRETEVVEAGTHRILVEHIVNPHRPHPTFRTRLSRIQPTIVVFGHTHQPFCDRLDGVLYLNPGSAGAARGGHRRSVCLLHLEDGIARPEIVPLG